MKIEEKTRIFAHFLFCDVTDGKITINMQVINFNIGYVADASGISIPIESCKLVLKDLKNISRKDACRCAELVNLPAALYKNWQVKVTYCNEIVFCWPDENPNYKNMIVFKEDKLNWRQIDYLRHAGYAVGLPEELYVTLKK